MRSGTSGLPLLLVMYWDAAKANPSANPELDRDCFHGGYSNAERITKTDGVGVYVAKAEGRFCSVQ